MTVEGQTRDKGHLLLKLVLILILSLLDLDNHLVEHANNIDGSICVACPGVLDVAESRVELAELFEVLDSRDADVCVEGDGGETCKSGLWGRESAGDLRGLGMGGAHTAAGMALPRRYMFLTTAHGSVPEVAAATRDAADARTAARAARRAMAGGIGGREGEETEDRGRQKSVNGKETWKDKMSSNNRKTQKERGKRRVNERNIYESATCSTKRERVESASRSSSTSPCFRNAPSSLAVLVVCT